MAVSVTEDQTALSQVVVQVKKAPGKNQTCSMKQTHGQANALRPPELAKVTQDIEIQ